MKTTNYIPLRKPRIVFDDLEERVFKQTGNLVVVTYDKDDDLPDELTIDHIPVDENAHAMQFSTLGSIYVIGEEGEDITTSDPVFQRAAMLHPGAMDDYPEKFRRLVEKLSMYGIHVTGVHRPVKIQVKVSLLIPLNGDLVINPCSGTDLQLNGRYEASFLPEPGKAAEGIVSCAVTAARTLYKDNVHPDRDIEYDIEYDKGNAYLAAIAEKIAGMSAGK